MSRADFGYKSGTPFYLNIFDSSVQLGDFIFCLLVAEGN